MIWGQMEGYLYLQLRDFKKGARQNEVMSQVVADLDRDDMAALAGLFCRQTLADARRGARQRYATPEWRRPLIRRSAAPGATSTIIRGPARRRGSPGRTHDYIIKTLTEFRTGARANNPGMTSLMKATSESDLVGFVELSRRALTACIRQRGPHRCRRRQVFAALLPSRSRASATLAPRLSRRSTISSMVEFGCHHQRRPAAVVAGPDGCAFVEQQPDELYPVVHRHVVGVPSRPHQDGQIRCRKRCRCRRPSRAGARTTGVNPRAAA